MADEQVDVLIIGGGLIGATLLLALANKGYKVCLAEAKPFESRLGHHFDARTLAISPASATILNGLGLWPLLNKALTPIETIHVSEQYRLGTTRLRNEGGAPLGFVIELQAIQAALHQLLPPDQIITPAQLTALDGGLATLQCGHQERCIQAKLIVAADGGFSTVRRLSGLAVKTKNYGQHALIANIGLNRDHHNHAYERFTRTGPLAMLPMTEKRAGLVWCLPPTEAETLKVMDESQFLKQLQQTFGYKLGRLIKVGQRTVYPLSQMIMPEQTAWPVVFVGNAAHTLHPVAGQGFNLGLRDVAALAQCIIRQGITPEMTLAYQAMRQSDQAAIVTLTDKMVRIFGSRIPGLGFGRSLGLMIMDNSALLKSILAHYTQGYAGVLSDLICNLPLDGELLDATRI